MPKNNLLKNAVDILDKYGDKQEEEHTAFMDEILGQKLSAGTDIFHSISIDDVDDPLKLLDLDPLLISPVLDKSEMLKNLSLLEEICGQSKSSAKQITSKFINEVSEKTLYPPGNIPPIDKNLIISSAQNIIDALSPNPPPKSSSSSSEGSSGSTGGIDDLDDFF